jgi:hypothetical protein
MSSASALPEELPDQSTDVISADIAAAERQRAFHVLPFLNQTQRDLLRRTFYKHLDDDQAAIFFEMMERYRLDPFLKQIWPSIRSTKDEDGVKHPTLVPITTLQSFRLIGDRSGVLEYEKPVEWCDEKGEWSEVWLHHPKTPYAARGTIKRVDRSQPQVTVCLWDQFVQKVYDRGGKEIPNRFWARMGSHMLGKCSLAGSYRGAFPNLASGLYIGDELGEELDPESEVAIEAEMTRRAAADKEHWDKERAKGNLPVNDLPPPPEKNGKKKKAATAPPPAPEKPAGEPSDPPTPSPSVPPKPMPPPPEPEPVTVSAPADPPWKDYPITRIKLFAGRTIGSLSHSELRGVRGNWMARVEQSWGSVDGDIKAHYAALMQRIEHDEAIERAAAEAAEATASLGEDAQRAALDDALNDMQLPFSP